MTGSVGMGDGYRVKSSQYLKWSRKKRRVYREWGRDGYESASMVRERPNPDPLSRDQHPSQLTVQKEKRTNSCLPHAGLILGVRGRKTLGLDGLENQRKSTRMLIREAAKSGKRAKKSAIGRVCCQPMAGLVEGKKGPGALKTRSLSLDWGRIGNGPSSGKANGVLSMAL